MHILGKFLICQSRISWVFRPDTLYPTSIRVTAATTAFSSPNEDWAISGPIDVNLVKKVDFGTPVSSFATLTPPGTFKYVYTQPGEYKVTFHAFNQDLNEVKSTTRVLNLAIVKK